MKKIILLTFSSLLLFFTLGADIVQANTGAANNLYIGSGISGDSQNVQKNDKLQDFNEKSQFIQVAKGGGEGVYNTLIRVARDIKNLFYAIATVYFLIIALRLIYAGNTEEEIKKFKQAIIWITVGLIVMQLAYSFVVTMFDQGVSARLGVRLLENIVLPLIALLQTLASLFFVAMAVLAFYKMVTAGGNEEAIKSGRTTIVHALIGFLIIRFAKVIVEAFYGKVSCGSYSSGFITTGGGNCMNISDVSQGVQVMINIINWLNGFVALAVLLMIIYAGAQILLSGGDEERLKKGRQSLIYIVIGLFVLALNYLILTVFLRPEGIL